MTDAVPDDVPDESYDDAADGTLLTLDELTDRVGTSVRNVRFYTSRGLVPPPIRRGRSGYYSADHVARLELVRELQGHGFTLAAIEKYVERIPADATPSDIALHLSLLAPVTGERHVDVAEGLACWACRPRRRRPSPRCTPSTAARWPPSSPRSSGPSSGRPSARPAGPPSSCARWSTGSSRSPWPDWSRPTSRPWTTAPRRTTEASESRS